MFVEAVTSNEKGNGYLTLVFTFNETERNTVPATDIQTTIQETFTSCDHKPGNQGPIKLS